MNNNNSTIKTGANAKMSALSDYEENQPQRPKNATLSPAKAKVLVQ